MSRVIRVSDKLLRGPRPKCDADLEELKSLGVTHMIALDRPLLWWLLGVEPWDDKRASGMGIKSFRLDMSWVLPPDLDTLESTLWLCETLLKDGRCVYVHCEHGDDRTGVAIAARRVFVEGWDPERALQEMFERGFHRTFYWYWVGAVRDHLERLEFERNENIRKGAGAHTT